MGTELSWEGQLWWEASSGGESELRWAGELWSRTSFGEEASFGERVRFGVKRAQQRRRALVRGREVCWKSKQWFGAELW